MATTTKGKAVATKADAKGKGKELATKKDQLPAAEPAFDMSQYAGGGMENTDRDSFAIPFLAIAQKMSPQVDKDDDRYLEDLEVGDLFLTTSQEIFKDEEGTDVVFCGFRRVFLRWAPRDQGGGFKGEMQVDDVAAGRATGEFKEVEGKLFANNGDLVRDTRIHYVVVVREDGTHEAAVISIASTQIKKSKMLLTQLNTYKAKDSANRYYTPPTFAHIFHAETIAEQNDQGSWRGWKFTRKGNIEDQDLFNFCVAFSESVRSNTVRVDHSANAEAAGASGSEDNGKSF
jgi:hypothetical protein